MPSFAGLGKFFGRTASEGAAFAAGIAVAPTLAPVVRELENEAWKTYTTKPVGLGDAAQIVAENVEQREWGVEQAAENGYAADKFDAVVGAILSAPGVPELLTLWRRGEINQADIEHGFRKARLETRWDKHLETLKEARLDPAVVALAIVRGLVADPGILPVGPPSEVGKVPAFPVFNVDALTEAEAHGLDRERLAVMVGNTGRPMAVVEAAHAAFRGIIERIDFDRAIAEGDIRNEWRDALYDVARQIPTAHDGIEARLRGWTDDAGMYAQTARHGMTKEDTDLLFKVLGRPLSFHQVFIGLRRGGSYDGPTGEIDPAFLKSLRESNVRPEWYNLAWAQRYTYPAAFVLRALTQGGDISQAESEQILLYEGWEPKLAAAVAAKWATTKAASGVSLSGKAKTSALTALHKSYVDDRTDATAARAMMVALGEPDPEQTATLAIWDRERALVRASLTPLQIKKAIGQPGRDHAWALARLADLGYGPADAETFLAE